MNIDTEKGIIEARSYHENYVKEASGAKPNTVRIVTPTEANMLRQLEVSIMDEEQAVTIVLIDAGSTLKPPDSVRRQVTDISFATDPEHTVFGQEIAVISWRHVSMEEPV